MRIKLKTARKASNLRQIDVAKYLGITVRFYQKIEHGHLEGRSRIWDALEDLFETSQRELRENATTHDDSITSEKGGETE